jgi:hypothetical protein
MFTLPRYEGVRKYYLEILPLLVVVQSLNDVELEGFG